MYLSNTLLLSTPSFQAWLKDVKTNLRVYRSSEDADGKKKWDYYSLECLLYFVRNIKRSHPDYVRQGEQKSAHDYIVDPPLLAEEEP